LYLVLDGPDCLSRTSVIEKSDILTTAEVLHIEVLYAWGWSGGWSERFFRRFGDKGRNIVVTAGLGDRLRQVILLHRVCFYKTPIMLIAGNVANGSLPPVSLKNKAGDRRDAAKYVSGNVIIVLITILSRLRIINIDW
jgi:hypothetical protein